MSDEINQEISAPPPEAVPEKPKRQRRRYIDKRRAASIMRNIKNFGKKTNAQRRLENEQAKAEALKLKEANALKEREVADIKYAAKLAAKVTAAEVREALGRPAKVFDTRNGKPVFIPGTRAATPPPKPTEPDTMMTADPVTGEPVRVGYTWKAGPDGSPAKVPDLPAPKAAEKPAPTVAETSKPAAVVPVVNNPEHLPPWAGRQPTRAELAAAHRAINNTPDQPVTFTPSQHHSPDWFARACAARNRREI